MKKYYYEGPIFKLWRGSWGPTFKLWGGNRVPGPRVPGSWYHLYTMPGKAISVLLFMFFMDVLVQLKKSIIMERNVKHLLLRKTDVPQSSIFLERKFEEMHELWRAKRYKVCSGERLYWYYRLQLSFFHKTVSQISFKWFYSGYKMLLSEFLRKWGWFLGHNERFPKYLG